MDTQMLMDSSIGSLAVGNRTDTDWSAAALNSPASLRRLHRVQQVRIATPLSQRQEPPAWCEVRGTLPNGRLVGVAVATRNEGLGAHATSLGARAESVYTCADEQASLHTGALTPPPSATVYTRQARYISKRCMLHSRCRAAAPC